MIKHDKIKADAQGNLAVRLPDVFICSEQYKKGDPIDVHFGTNTDILIITSLNKGLSRDNKERIRILLEVKDTTKAEIKEEAK